MLFLTAETVIEIALPDLHVTLAVCHAVVGTVFYLLQ